MFIPGQQSFFELVGGLSIVAISIFVTKIFLNAVFARLVGDRIIDRWVLQAKKKFKAYQTRYKKIKADLEFTAYVNTDSTVGEANEAIESTVQNSVARCRGGAEVEEFQWIDETIANVTVTYLNNDPFEITFELIQDNNSFTNLDVHSVDDAQLASIGVNIRFEFDFRNLKGVLMDVGTFAQFLRESLKDQLNVRKVTESRFKVGTLENDLTLDDWIQEQRFETSLLLEDDRGERSIEFRGDEAVITAPYPEVDDQTAEYIRLTLLNYYL
jgi:hypothetical protein